MQDSALHRFLYFRLPQKYSVILCDRFNASPFACVQSTTNATLENEESMTHPKKILLALGIVAPLGAMASEYPTLETVDHVLTCMQTNGGQTVENLYACSCQIDYISRNMNFDEFSEAQTYQIYKRMPGEKGGLFRDNPRAEELVGKVDALREEADRRCFLGVKRANKAAEG